MRTKLLLQQEIQARLRMLALICTLVMFLKMLMFILTLPACCLSSRVNLSNTLLLNHFFVGKIWKKNFKK